jgi:hypothetical protein
MKKLTQLITESTVNFDSIEDVMIHLEDMGFKIEIFNDLGGIRGVKGSFFGPGNFDDIYHKMNSRAFQPSVVNCYPVYIISLVKKFYPFSDCDLYGKVVNEAEVIKRRLNTCKVFYRIDTTSITGASIDSGLYGDTEKNLQITFHITDKSYKISLKSINDRKSIINWFNLIVKTYKITNIYSTKWDLDSVSIKISTRYGYADEIKGALIALESQENLDKIVSGYKITKSSEAYTLLGTEYHDIIITYSPK